MKIVIIGSRGIPAKYGGFETFAEGLATRLVEKGYDITVTCEYEPQESRINDYKGVKLKYFSLKSPKNYSLRKVYETISDINFLIKLSRKYDMIYFLGTEVGIFLFIPSILKKKLKLLVNIDGVMWKRDKFSRLEKWILKKNHDFATIFADVIIADAEEMKKHVDVKYHNKTVYIPYGINSVPEIQWNKSNLRKLTIYEEIKNLSLGKYWLVVARLEPENNIRLIIEGFSKANLNMPLIVVGDFTSSKYQDYVYEIMNGENRIYFTGAIYDLELLDMLRQNCFAYIHGHTVGGTNPSLLEAMIMKNIIIAHDNGFNREVCRESAVYFKDSDDLKNQMELIEKNPQEYSKLKDLAYNEVKSRYLWKKIVNEYDYLFKKVFKE